MNRALFSLLAVAGATVSSLASAQPMNLAKVKYELDVAADGTLLDRKVDD